MTRPERVYRLHALILRHQPLGEADQVLTVFSRERGKQRVLAKGARKPTSRKAGHLELFCVVDLIMGSGRTFDVISQADMHEAFLPLRDDLVRLTYAAHFIELLDALTGDHDENPALFDLAVEGLTWLCRLDDLDVLARRYEIHVLSGAGYAPQLTRCISCEELLQPRDQYYSPADGGALCPNCGADHPRARPLTLSALKVMRHLQRSPVEAVEKLSISPPTARECRALLFGSLAYTLERRLRSAAFLERLQREAAR